MRFEVCAAWMHLADASALPGVWCSGVSGFAPGFSDAITP